MGAVSASERRRRTGERHAREGSADGQCVARAPRLSEGVARGSRVGASAQRAAAAQLSLGGAAAVQWCDGARRRPHRAGRATGGAGRGRTVRQCDGRGVVCGADGRGRVGPVNARAVRPRPGYVAARALV